VKEEIGRIGGLHYAMVGDLRFGRTVHSLIYLLGLYEDIRLTLVSPEKLMLPDEVLNFIREKGIPFRQTASMNDMVSEKPDVVYMTRVQTERLRSLSIKRSELDDSRWAEEV